MGCMSGSESQQQSKSYLPAQSKAIKAGLNTYLPWLGKGQVSYEGPRVAPMEQGQLDAIQSAYGMIPQFSGNEAMPLYQESGDTLRSLLSGQMGAQPITQEQRDKYFTNVMRNPVAKTLSEDILPGVREAYSGAGNFWSGDRTRAQAKTTQDVFENLQRSGEALDWDILGRNQQLEEARAGRAQGAISQALEYGRAPTQMAQSKLDALGKIYGFGQMSQQQKQAEIDAAMQKFQEGQRLTDPEKLAILMSFATTPMQHSSGTGSGAGLGYAVLGNAGNSFFNPAGKES